jgi:PPK2 family polyphosphate:nucleotide phosphotransferase
MKIDSDKFRVHPDTNVRLSKTPTKIEPFYKSKDKYRDHLKKQVSELSDQQERLYGSDRYALLLIFQGMDASGKDGAIRHVMSGINPQGCDVASFKQPSAAEREHDFLWRTYLRLPERGRIGIFNRSYYEEVLVVRVHPEMLQAEGLSEEIRDDDNIWAGRYRSIVDMEHHLHHNGTRTIKFFLHISKEEQRKRFLARIDDTEKNWKFSVSDMKERKYWDQYNTAFEECLNATSTHFSPWYVVPADDKDNARLIISSIVLDTIKSLKLSYPKTTPEHRAELLALRKQLKK